MIALPDGVRGLGNIIYILYVIGKRNAWKYQNATPKYITETHKTMDSKNTDTFWVTKTGKAFHSNPTCAGANSINIAVSQVGNRTPCQKCIDFPSCHEDSEYIFTVAGVSYNNDDGSSRQRNLVKILGIQKVFKPRIRLHEYSFRGQRALYVVVNGLIVGNVPADEVATVNHINQRINDISISIYGGGYGKYYGAEVTLHLDDSRWQ